VKSTRMLPIQRETEARRCTGFEIDRINSNFLAKKKKKKKKGNNLKNFVSM
jgi:hypothetical protein